MSYRLVKFGATELPIYNPLNDVGTGAAKSRLVEVVGGYWDAWGDRQAPQEPGLITKKFLVDLDQETIDATYRGLRALEGQRDRLYRIWSDGLVEWCWARCLKITSGREARHNLVEAIIEFERTSPTWFTNWHGGWTLDSGVDLDSGYVLDSADITGTLSSGANNITCPNTGNAPVRNARITITGGTGASLTELLFRAYALADPSFTIVYEFTWAGGLTAGQVLVVDCGKQAITKEGVGEYANLTVAKKPHWLVIPAGGANLIINPSGTIGSGTTYKVEYWEASQ